MPPKEGQMVLPPPSDRSMEAGGKLAKLMTEGVPGLDLDGNTPVQVPNTPPPMPPPMDPPRLPRIIPPEKPPPALDPALMTPAPVAFGLDVARTIPNLYGPSKESNGVMMPAMPDFSALKHNPKGVSFLSRASTLHVRGTPKGKRIIAR